MTALSADRNTPFRNGEKMPYGVAANAKIWTGGLVFVNASGYAVAASQTAGLFCAGVAEAAVDNTGGANGAATVIAQSRRLFCFVNGNSLTIANVGQTAYALDDQTVTNIATGATAVGTIKAVDSQGVWVFIS